MIFFNRLMYVIILIGFWILQLSLFFTKIFVYLHRSLSCIFVFYDNFIRFYIKNFFQGSSSLNNIGIIYFL